MTGSQLRALLTDWYLYSGLILAIGMSGFGSVTIYGLVALHIGRRFNLNPWSVGLAGIVGITSLWSTNWLTPLIWGATVICLGSLWRHLRITPSFAIGVGIVMILHMILAWSQLFDGIKRPDGLTPNASVLGMAGFAAIQASPVSGLFGAFVLGMSGSRTYLTSVALMGLWWLWKRDSLKVGIAIIAGLTAITVAMHMDILGRFYPLDNSCDSGKSCSEGKGLIATYERRENLNNPENTEPVENPGRPKEIHVADNPVTPTLWKHLRSHPFGFGYRDYNHETSRSLPHNQFVLILWELGWLAVPFGGLILGMAWKNRSSWPWLISFLPGLWLTTEYYNQVNGLYTVSIVMLGALAWQRNRV